MVRQRVHAIALGYEDLNDHDALCDDLVVQTACERDGSLASSSTLCRFEQRAERQWAIAIHQQLVEQFIGSFAHRPRELALDFDATDDPIHGHQPGRFFHGYYDRYCYLPLYVFCGQQLLVAYLRPSNIDASKHAWGIFSLLVHRFREKWPGVDDVVRGDSAFCRHRMLDWCERNGVRYIVGLERNAVVEREVRVPCEVACDGGRSRKNSDIRGAAWRRYIVVRRGSPLARSVCGRASQLRDETVNLEDILSALNDLAPKYRFGALQDIRKARRPLQKRPSRHPFGIAHEGWAHHVGGRRELQFNVGEEEDMLRWGLAVSLQPSRSLPDVTVQHPRLRKLSSMLEVHGDYLHRLGLEMWDWTSGAEGRGRSRNRVPQRVADYLYRPGAFVFVGRQAPIEAFNPEHVLQDFNTLLPVYEFVEFEPDGTPPALYTRRGFVFAPEREAAEDWARATTVTRTSSVSQVSLRHRVLQDALKSELEREGAVVSIENRDGRGGYIDLVACRDGEYEFYEIKTDASARLAIRHAIGQLLEYAYWPTAARPKRVVVVAERPLDPEAADYLRTLEAETGLAIGYRHVNPAE